MGKETPIGTSLELTNTGFTTAELIKQSLDDGVSKNELREIAKNYKEEKDKMQESTKSNLNSLLKSFYIEMLDNGMKIKDEADLNTLEDNLRALGFNVKVNLKLDFTKSKVITGKINGDELILSRVCMNNTQNDDMVSEDEFNKSKEEIKEDLDNIVENEIQSDISAKVNELTILLKDIKLTELSQAEELISTINKLGIDENSSSKAKFNNLKNNFNNLKEKFKKANLDTLLNDISKLQSNTDSANLQELKQKVTELGETISTLEGYGNTDLESEKLTLNALETIVKDIETQVDRFDKLDKRLLKLLSQKSFSVADSSHLKNAKDLIKEIENVISTLGDNGYKLDKSKIEGFQTLKDGLKKQIDKVKEISIETFTKDKDKEVSKEIVTNTLKKSGIEDSDIIKKVYNSIVDQRKKVLIEDFTTGKGKDDVITDVLIKDSLKISDISSDDITSLFDNIINEKAKLIESAQKSAKAPITPESTKTQAPITPESTKTQAPITPESTKTQAPITPESTKTQAPTTANSKGTQASATPESTEKQASTSEKLKEQKLNSAKAFYKRMNASKDHIKLIQNALIDEGYELPKYGADGGFGAETYNVLEDYQYNNELKEDGKAGTDTLRALGLIGDKEKSKDFYSKLKVLKKDIVLPEEKKEEPLDNPIEDSIAQGKAKEEPLDNPIEDSRGQGPVKEEPTILENTKEKFNDIKQWIIDLFKGNKVDSFVGANGEKVNIKFDEKTGKFEFGTSFFDNVSDSEFNLQDLLKNERISDIQNPNAAKSFVKRYKERMEKAYNQKVLDKAIESVTTEKYNGGIEKHKIKNNIQIIEEFESKDGKDLKVKLIRKYVAGEFDGVYLKIGTTFSNKVSSEKLNVENINPELIKNETEKLKNKYEDKVAKKKNKKK